MQTLVMNIGQIPRKTKVVFPVQRIGFLIPHHKQERRTFTNKLELCLRLFSDTSCAIDEIDGKLYRTPYPHVVLKLPDSVHSYEVEGKREAVYLQYPPELEHAMREAGLFNTPRIWCVDVTPEIRSQLTRLNEMLPEATKPGMAEQIDLLAMSLFLHLIRQDPVRQTIPEDAAERIGRISNYIHLHFTEEIDLDALIRRNGFSRRSFFRYWQKTHDSGPADYIRTLRIQHAAELLAETSLSVAAIAQKVNISNIFYFARVFRRSLGMTPNEYRKNSRNRFR